MALIVTIVVLLILAGITIMYVMGDNSVFKQALNAKEQTEIAQWQEKLETAKSSIIIEDLGTFNSEKYFKKISNQGIMQGKEIDNGDGSYNVTTESGYVFLVTLKPNKENPRDAEIEYIGQAGKIAPIIKRLDVSATSKSITGKAVVAKIENVNIEYWYKLKTQNDEDYKKMEFISDEDGAKVDLSPVEGATYVVKVVAKNEAGEKELTAEVTIGVKVKSITLAQTNVTVTQNETIQLTPNILPDNAENKEVEWKAEPTSITKVDKNGNITGVAEGEATITVTAKDGSGKSASCSVIVESDWRKIAEVAKLVAEDSSITKDAEHITKAGISFEFMDCLGILHNMNGTKTDGSDSTNENGWTATEMKTFLDDEIKSNRFSEVFKNSVKQVRKQYIKTYNDASSNNNYSEDKLWLLAASEIFATGYKEGAHAYAITTEGDQYKVYKKINPTYTIENDKLIKKNNGSIRTWWLRSPYYNKDTHFCHITSSGLGSNVHWSYYPNGVAPGFSI